MTNRYSFDLTPFEQDIFSHFFLNVAQANVAAAERYGEDRAAIAQAVERAILTELRVILPSMNPASMLGLRAGFPDAIRHPAFGKAWLLIREAASHYRDFLTISSSVEPAIIMAALGIPVIPLRGTDLDNLAPPTSDVDSLLGLWETPPHPIVGFVPASLDHYFLVSGSIRSLRRCLTTDPRFQPLREIIRPADFPLPKHPTGTCGIRPKQQGQRIGSVWHKDNPDGPLITVFIGGWMEDGKPCDNGAPLYQP
ncbi:MAG: hypothetical protein QM690_19740, partial [Sphingobium sp.]